MFVYKSTEIFEKFIIDGNFQAESISGGHVTF